MRKTYFTIQDLLEEIISITKFSPKEISYIKIEIEKKDKDQILKNISMYISDSMFKLTLNNIFLLSLNLFTLIDIFIDKKFPNLRGKSFNKKKTYLETNKNILLSKIFTILLIIRNYFVHNFYNNHSTHKIDNNKNILALSYKNNQGKLFRLSLQLSSLEIIYKIITNLIKGETKGRSLFETIAMYNYFIEKDKNLDCIYSDMKYNLKIHKPSIFNLNKLFNRYLITDKNLERYKYLVYEGSNIIISQNLYKILITSKEQQYTGLDIEIYDSYLVPWEYIEKINFRLSKSNIYKWKK